jgi:hypothetical protein
MEKLSETNVRDISPTGARKNRALLGKSDRPGHPTKKSGQLMVSREKVRSAKSERLRGQSRIGKFGRYSAGLISLSFFALKPAA